MYVSWAQFLSPRAALPSPFTWIYYIARAVYMSKGGGLQLTEETSFEEKRNYLWLLKKLVLVKEQKENEQMADEKIEDLRRDIRNDWMEWTKTNEGLKSTNNLKILRIDESNHNLKLIVRCDTKWTKPLKLQILNSSRS